MTTLNSQLLDSLRTPSNGAFMTRLEQLINVIPSFASLRGISQSNAAGLIVRYADPSNPDDKVQDGAGGEYRAADPTKNKPPELVMNRAMFEGNLSTTNLAGALELLLHEYGHHLRVDNQAAAFSALTDSDNQLTPAQRATSYVNAMLDDETRARYDGYAVVRDLIGLVPGDAGRLQFLVEKNPV